MHAELDRAFSLSGRVAVLTGAAGGIGRQSAITLAQAGADVVIADLGAGLEQTAEEVRSLGRLVTVVPTDVTKRSSVDALAAAAMEAHGRIDVWCNIAGLIRYADVVDVTDEMLDLIIDTNLKGVFYGCAAAARVMVSQGSGSIINVASTGMDIATPGISCYAMSKAAVAMLSRSLAAEVGPAGVRVNTIAPGWVPTGMTSVYWTDPDGTADEARKEAIVDQRAAAAPLRRVSTPSDQALAILYLASDAAGFVTGQVLRANGGMSMI
ncbi:MAG: 3-oxoacyl-ACP reductase [Acidimicrobiia bacterium]|nr:3-oxoacyl-ACP reductase [Acidimicrobiia bacterium]